MYFTVKSMYPTLRMYTKQRQPPESHCHAPHISNIGINDTNRTQTKDPNPDLGPDHKSDSKYDTRPNSEP